MSIITKFLQLFEYDPETDGASTFNIPKALNENWDKIDAWASGIKDTIAGLVPSTRTINKKPLSEDVTLTGEDIPAGAEDAKTLSSHLAECKKRLKDAVRADYTHITTLDDLMRYRNVFTCVSPPATGMPYPDYWNCIVWADSRESTEQHYSRVIYASPANKNELWKLNLTNGAKSEWVCIATATLPEEIPLNLAAGIIPIESMKNACNKDQFGIVRVWLSVHFASIPHNNDPVLTLPEGFRPSATCFNAATLAYGGSMYAANLFASPDGTVRISHRADAHVGVINLHGFIDFPAR